MQKQMDIMDYISTQTMLHGDCLEEMRKMPDNSIDFVITDPPYGLHFMGKHWDSRTPNIDIWQQAWRICKPGSMLAAFGAPRTHHKLMHALECAGFDLRDVIMWLHGQGFPKSKGCLKPAYEPIILARKPGPNPRLNIEECRIEGKRWPANIILDEFSSEQLDEMTGILKSGSGDKHSKSQKGKTFSGLNPISGLRKYEADSGGASRFFKVVDQDEQSRFFYCAKASSAERNKGLEGYYLKENTPKHIQDEIFSLLTN